MISVENSALLRDRDGQQTMNELDKLFGNVELTDEQRDTMLVKYAADRRFLR